jgi:putative ABC transport system permease protein
MVVSESFAARYFPDGSAVGQRVAFDWNMEGFQEVIGVVGDVRHDALGGAPQPTVYVSHLQRPNDYMTVAIRAKVPAATIAGAVRAAVATVDAGRPITAMRTMETVLDESVEGRRVALWLVGSFAALGLILAATGIYGVVSYTTGLRRREVGIRVALGAARGEVLRVVVGRSAAMIAAGLAAGAVACVLLGGVIRSQLFGVEPTDATTFAFAIATLIVVALAAAWLPARASLRVDPARVLRSE